MENFFDEIIERRGTSCLKYDFAVERGKPADVLPFWVADMDFRTPPQVVEELVRRSQHGIFGYTDAQDDYKKSVAEWFTARHGWTPKKNSLVITPGVVFAVCMAVRAFTRENDSVLICPPVYYPFFSSILDNRRKLVQSPLVLKNNFYEIDFDDFEKKISDNQVKIFILCSPHNPVGRVWRREELEKIGEICLRHKVLVVADEIHCDFVRRGFRHINFASISPELEKITITCTSASKTFNLAGLQTANIFIADDELRKIFREEIAATGYSQPNTLGLFAAKAAYDFGASWLDGLTDYLEKNLLLTKNFLAENLPSVKLVEPEGTYLIWLDFSAYKLPPAELDRKIIREGKLWLDSGKIFGEEGKNFQRINIACPKKILLEGLTRLANCLKIFETGTEK